MFVALAAISFASCGNKAEAPATTDTTNVDTTNADTTKADTTKADTVKADTVKTAEPAK